MKSDASIQHFETCPFESNPMNNQSQIVIPFNIYSASAVSAGRRYVTLVAEQLSLAHANDRNEALRRYRALSDPNEADYDVHVHSVDRYYEDDYFPMLYLTSVVYLYMVFDTYVSRHIVEIQRFFGDGTEILKSLKTKNECGIVEAAHIYFRDHAKIAFFTDEQWTQLREIACVRNCIVHYSGIPRDYIKHRDSIYGLEKRIWRNQPVGLQIDRYEGRDLGCPMMLNQRFMEYCLNVLEEFFQALGAAAEEKIKQRSQDNS
jgi:hypothetical protein